MAKRTAMAEEPYNPLDAALAQSVIVGGSFSSRIPANGIGPSEVGEPDPQLSGGARVDLSFPIPAVRPSRKPSPESTERRCREKRVVLSRSEERQIERLVDRMADQMKTSLKLSHVLRAAVSVLLHAEEELIGRLESDARLERPSNWDTVALARFEHELAKILSQALRDAPPLR